jgi:hypothetical protein
MDRRGANSRRTERDLGAVRYTGVGALPRAVSQPLLAHSPPVSLSRNATFVRPRPVVGVRFMSLYHASQRLAGEHGRAADLLIKTLAIVVRRASTRARVLSLLVRRNLSMWTLPGFILCCTGTIIGCTCAATSSRSSTVSSQSSQDGMFLVLHRLMKPLLFVHRST